MDSQRVSRRRPKRVTTNCTTCKHVVFDELWGEYIKCKLKKIRIPGPNGYINCKEYEKDTASTEK